MSDGPNFEDFVKGARFEPGLPDDCLYIIDASCLGPWIPRKAYTLRTKVRANCIIHGITTGEDEK